MSFSIFCYTVLDQVAKGCSPSLFILGSFSRGLGGRRKTWKGKNIFPMFSWLSLERRKGAFIFSGDSLTLSTSCYSFYYFTYLPKLWGICSLGGLFQLRNCQYICFRSCRPGFHYFCYPVFCGFFFFNSCEVFFGVFEIFMHNLLCLQALTRKSH